MEDWSFMKRICPRHEQGATGRGVALIIEVLWPSPPGTFHILIGKFFFFIVRVYHKAIK